MTNLMHYLALHHWSIFQTNFTLFGRVMAKKPLKSSLKSCFLLLRKKFEICRVMHQICHGFYCVKKKKLELNQKTYFLAHFERFFIWALLRPTSRAPIFIQNKDLIKLHNCGQFHKHRICDFEIINFQKFLHYPWNGPFLGVLMPSFPKKAWFRLNFQQRYC